MRTMTPEDASLWDIRVGENGIVFEPPLPPREPVTAGEATYPEREPAPASPARESRISWPLFICAAIVTVLVILALRGCDL